MMSIVYGVLLLCAFGKIGAKAELHVYLEEISINELDPKYFNEENTEAYISDDNTITTNLTIMESLPPDCEGHFKLLAQSMGKYKTATGVDIWMDLCDLLGEPILIGPFFAVLGFSEDDCPPPPGTYVNEHFTLPMDNLPDDFPDNKYLASFEIARNQETIIQIDVYVDVQH